MAVQHVPVPGPPELSMMACCSGGISPCSFAACTASAADRILGCNFAKPCPEPGSSAGLCRPTAQESGGRSLQPACPLPTGLPRTICWPHFRSPLWQIRALGMLINSSAFAARAPATSGCTLHIGLFSASHMFVMTALCRSTADQHVASAAWPI